MKRLFISLVMLAITLTIHASEWKPISSTTPKPCSVRVLESGQERSTLQFSLPGFNLRQVTTPAGMAQVVEVEGMTPILEAGAPDLPKATFSLAIPDQASMEISFKSIAYQDFPDMMIAPSKGVLTRDVNPALVPYQFGAHYAADNFFPEKLTDMREPYIIRDLRGQTFILYPFLYNPVTKVLRVFTELTVEVKKVSDNGINPLTGNIAGRRYNAEMRSLLSRQFMNFDAINYTPVEDYGRLLVICHAAFMEKMQPYVDWKRASGYPTEIISKDSAGTNATQIRSFIANYYATKGLTHVLLVGDHAQVPTYNSTGVGGPSDNAYGYIVGNDHYADVFIGRFSAETVAHVETQVQRTLDYEMNPQFIGDDWYTTVAGIASDQGPGDDEEMDYEHIRNQQSQLLAYKYTSNPEFFDGSQGGNDANGNPTPPMIANAVNDGTGLILYTGHGSNNAWSTSGFSNNNVNQLTNAGKLPFIWSVACVNGNFLNITCFAEAWLRASQNGQPTGAIAFLGSTINQSWDSPMEGQDEMTDILAESYSNNIRRTFAGISISGCMKMIDSYGMDGSNMADTWTIFGDPTVMVRTSQPTALTVVHDTVLFTGDTSLLVLCNAPGARATLSSDDSIVATGLFQNDSLLLAFSSPGMAGDTLQLVVTGYNNIPYRFSIPVEELVLIPVTAGFTAAPATVIPGGNVSFADTSAGTVLFREWTFEGGSPATSTEANPVVSYAERGVYDVILVVGNGISLDTLHQVGYITCDFPATAGGLLPGQSFVITPNPTNGNFRIIAAGSHPEMDIAIYNTTGTLVFLQQKLAMERNREGSVNAGHLAPGIYFARLTAGSESATLKLIVR